MLSNELRKIGLSDKEAAVYLAALELGTDTVQNIARKSKVNRATTYVILESLLKKGIVTTQEKGKKTFFAAEPPESLSALVRIREQEVKEMDHLLNQVLPELRSVYNLSAEKPVVKYYEGVDGIKAIQEDILRSGDPEMEGVVDYDTSLKIFPPAPSNHRDRMQKKGLKFNLIANSELGEKLLSQVPSLKSIGQIKFVTKEKFNFPAEIQVYKNKVSFIPYKSKLGGIVIEDKDIVQTIRSLFKLAWESIKN